MSKNFDIKKLTVIQICNYIAVVNKLVDEKLIKFNPNKAAVIFNHNKASIFLEEQNIKLKQSIDKAIEILDDENITFPSAKEWREHLKSILRGK